MSIFFAVAFVILFLYVRVIVHEMGHYIAAKIVGANVTGVYLGVNPEQLTTFKKFSIGFNPTIGCVDINPIGISRLSGIVILISGFLLEILFFGVFSLFAFCFLPMYVFGASLFVMALGAVNMLNTCEGSDTKELHRMIIKGGDFFEDSK